MITTKTVPKLFLLVDTNNEKQQVLMGNTG
jgi:hypothetical protein